MKKLYEEFPGLRGPTEHIAGRISTELYDTVERFCKENKITKTEAVRRGLCLLLEQASKE